MFLEIEDEMRTTAATHQFRFKDSGTMLIDADREKISQVLYNFIGNAVKYSNNGSLITIEYAIVGNRLKISIEDQGKGISNEDQQRIFERYYRVKDSNNSSIAGFGIGLYLCKEIIELHNGTIEVKSRINQGTTFTFNLPIN